MKMQVPRFADPLPLRPYDASECRCMGLAFSEVTSVSRRLDGAGGRLAEVLTSVPRRHEDEVLTSVPRRHEDEVLTSVPRRHEVTSVAIGVLPTKMMEQEGVTSVSISVLPTKMMEQEGGLQRCRRVASAPSAASPPSHQESELA